IKHADAMVASAFVSFRDFDLWDAWFRVWVLANFISTTLNGTLYMRYLKTGDRSLLQLSNQEPRTVLLAGRFPEFQVLFTRALAEMDGVRDGQSRPSEAALRIRELFKGLNYFPSYYRWHDPAVRTTSTFTVWQLIRLLFWYLLHCP